MANQLCFTGLDPPVPLAPAPLVPPLPLVPRRFAPLAGHPGPIGPAAPAGGSQLVSELIDVASPLINVTQC